MSYQSNPQYKKFKTLSIVLGILSLLSPVIMLLAGSLFTGNIQAFVFVTFLSIPLTLVALLVSISLAASARGIRVAWEDAQKADKAQSHS